MIRLICVALLALGLCVVAAAYYLARPVMEGSLQEADFSGLRLAPVADALTLAYSHSGEVVLVTALDKDGISGVRLNRRPRMPYSNALAAASAVPEQELSALAGLRADARFSWAELDVPVPRSRIAIAAGTNYRAHAEEVGLDEGPFLFPKIAEPTAWDAAVHVGGRLDYEVELCAVTLDDHRIQAPARLGYLLCGDYTDRLQLVRDIDLDGPLGVTGFPSAKGGPTRFPVGPLLVLPRTEGFVAQVELRLYLNRQLRQRSGVDKMIWSAQTMLEQALAQCETDFETPSGPVRLTGCATVPDGTLLLTGTPEGVLFHLATLWHRGLYLQEGDVVTSFGTYLGYMRNEIVAP